MIPPEIKVKRWWETVPCPFEIIVEAYPGQWFQSAEYEEWMKR